MSFVNVNFRFSNLCSLNKTKAFGTANNTWKISYRRRSLVTDNFIIIGITKESLFNPFLILLTLMKHGTEITNNNCINKYVIIWKLWCIIFQWYTISRNLYFNLVLHYFMLFENLKGIPSSLWIGLSLISVHDDYIYHGRERRGNIYPFQKTLRWM